MRGPAGRGQRSGGGPGLPGDSVDRFGRDVSRAPAGRPFGDREMDDDRLGRPGPSREEDRDRRPVPIERDWDHRGPGAAPGPGPRVKPWDEAPLVAPRPLMGPVDDFTLPTVVDYGHRPADGGPSLAAAVQPPPAAPTLEPVATFDYGHGGASSSSRPSPPRSPPAAWRERDRWERERMERERLDRERMERERLDRDLLERERDRFRERERDDRFFRDRRRFDDDRFGDRFGDRGRNGTGPGGPGPSGPRWRDRERDRDRRRRPSPLREPPPAPPPPSVAGIEPAGPALPRPVLIEDLLCPPGRTSRPTNFVVILRGPPGSGKSYLAKLIKEKEVEQGGATPRMLSLDDYFVTEVEKEERDPETGRKVKTKVMEYEYEAAIEGNYRESLTKAFKKTISDGYFSFLIVDSVNDKVSHFEEMWTFAKSKGFQVYICEMDRDLQSCLKHNIHNRNEKDIKDMIEKWEDTPRQYLRTDPTSMLQSAAIEDVEMKDAEEEEATKQEEGGEKKDDEEENDDEKNVFMSKWEQMESQGETMDRLDGLAKRRKDGAPQTLEDYLQLSDDYEEKKATPGKKQVRWADLEERRKQEKMRAIGFVVGQTDWSRMTDPTFGEGALTHTKYI